MQAEDRARCAHAHGGRLKLQRGCVFLAIDNKSATHDCLRKLQSDHVPASFAKFQQERDLDRFHCTLAHAGELQKEDISLHKIGEMMRDDRGSHQTSIAADGDVCIHVHFDILGVGSKSDCWFAILSVPAGDVMRTRWALSSCPFHVTLGFATRDIHSIVKDCGVMFHWVDNASLLSAAKMMNISKPVASKAAHELACILHHFEASSSCYPDIASVRMRMIKALINSGNVAEAQSFLCAAIDHAANVGDADAVLDVVSVRHVMTVGYRLKPQHEALAHALASLNMYSSIIDGKRVSADPNQRKLLREIGQFVVGSSQESHLRRFWDIQTNNTLRQVPLPLNFSLQGSCDLAGSGEPSASSILGISAAGFKTVVTLTERELSSDVKAAAQHIRYKHMPVNDRHAPATLADLLMITDAIRSAEAPVLVHCLGGKGRTAMVLAAILMIARAEETGVPHSASQALALVKDVRSVIVSAEQVQMLSELYAHLTSLEWTRPIFPAPRIMCVGLPCSGKSTFITNLMQSFGARSVMVASQDDLGREECEHVWARTPSTGSVCVLDRCNSTMAERRYWLDMCNRAPTSCVFFNVDPSVCIRRSAGRHLHPTLPAGRAPRIIEQLSSHFQAPTQAEGFVRIDEIKNDQDFSELMSRFGVPAPHEEISFSDEVVAFPRTAHLINLGAATEDDEILFKTHGKDSDAVVDERIKQVCKGASTITIEEKVDGANMGFRLMSDGSIAVQNRSHFVTSKSGEQFKRLDQWMDAHSAQLHALLKSPRWILYGCAESIANVFRLCVFTPVHTSGSGCTWSTVFTMIVSLIIFLLLTCVHPKACPHARILVTVSTCTIALKEFFCRVNV